MVWAGMGGGSARWGKVNSWVFLGGGGGGGGGGLVCVNYGNSQEVLIKGKLTKKMLNSITESEKDLSKKTQV